jgi:scyllo-inositol 2-dehydrogenase (NADP+)
MRVIVLGLGVQGHKRRDVAGEDVVATVDPYIEEADFRSVEDVPLSAYDAVLACIPDSAKIDVLKYCLANGKHVLVEKPLLAGSRSEIESLASLAKAKNVVCYTAYNHRFEPHFVRMRDLLESGVLGEIYTCRMFYGNGTARLVQESAWRDVGAGVLPDLGSHLLDTIRFWFGDRAYEFELLSAHRFENRAPDHVTIVSSTSAPAISLEMTLLMWRNHFTCDILAEKGSAHIASLCKWGPTSFVHRTRVMPSGRPPEESVTLVQEDPTWEAEYEYFKKLCVTGSSTSLVTDMWLNDEIQRLSAVVGSEGTA